MRTLLAVGLMGATLVALDLLWLGVVAAERYNRALGALRAPQVVWLAAGLFYVLYVGGVYFFAVAGTDSVGQAAGRGALLGLLCYGTYELTNWAVIAGWPASIVPIDIAWGAFLTGAVAAAGRAARG